MVAGLNLLPESVYSHPGKGADSDISNIPSKCFIFLCVFSSEAFHSQYYMRLVVDETCSMRNTRNSSPTGVLHHWALHQPVHVTCHAIPRIPLMLPVSVFHGWWTELRTTEVRWVYAAVLLSIGTIQTTKQAVFVGCHRMTQVRWTQLQQSYSITSQASLSTHVVWPRYPTPQSSCSPALQPASH